MIKGFKKNGEILKYDYNALGNLPSNTSLVEPMEDDIPKVFIDGVIPTTKDDVYAEMTYISKTEQFHAYLKIKCQGSSSMAYDKKNFTIKMYSDEARETKLKKAFKDWKFEQNKYVLKANYIDHSHARNIVSARLWNEVVSSRSDYDSLPTEFKTSPNNGAIDGFPVKVYTNGTYQGIYTWNIGKDDWLWGMDEDNPNHILLCAESNTNDTFAETACNFRKLWNGNESAWGVEVGTNSDVLKQGLNNLISCVKDTDDETFVATIGSCLDLQSAIDYYIHQYVICGLDGLAKNMLLGTYNLQTAIETNQMLKYPYAKDEFLPEGPFETGGVTFTDNGDGSFEMQGTATETVYFNIFPNIEGRRLALEAGTYTISLGSCENYWISGNVLNANGDKLAPFTLDKKRKQSTFTIDTDGELFIFIVVDSGVTVNETVYPMLNKGSVALPFESYTNISAKWIMGAYDMDSTFGLFWNGSSFVSSEYRCPEDYQEKHNLLFERITELYAERVKERYVELRNTVYSFSNLFNHFERFMDIIGKDLYAEDLEVYSAIPNGSTNNIKQIRDYIRARLYYCDMQFGLIEENQEIDYTLNPLANVTWTDGYTYDITTGGQIATNGEHCTDKFQLQDCTYEFNFSEAGTYGVLFVWDENGNYVAYRQHTNKSLCFVANSKFTYAIKVYQINTFNTELVKLMPKDNRENAVPTVSLLLSELEWRATDNGVETTLNNRFTNTNGKQSDEFITSADGALLILSEMTTIWNKANESDVFIGSLAGGNVSWLSTKMFSDVESAMAYFKEHNTTIVFNK